jgi:hypothetical protein
MIEPESHHIVSAKVATGMLHGAPIIPVSDIKNVGTDSVTISTSQATGVAVATEETSTVDTTNERLTTITQDQSELVERFAVTEAAGAKEAATQSAGPQDSV